jgi:hypothetical protein
MSGRDDRLVAVTGTVFGIEYAVGEDGVPPAKEFIDALDEGDQRKLAVLFKRMADHGSVPNREQFKQVRGPLFEFKKHQIRVFCFRSGSRWVLTNGYKKKKDRLDPAEIERAERLMEVYLSRNARHRGQQR